MYDGGFSARIVISIRRRVGDYRAHRRLLDHDILDIEVLKLEVLRVRIRLGVLQEAEEEADGLLRPAT
jgi:hypothetical protein